MAKARLNFIVSLPETSSLLVAVEATAFGWSTVPCLSRPLAAIPV